MTPSTIQNVYVLAKNLTFSFILPLKVFQLLIQRGLC